MDYLFKTKANYERKGTDFNTIIQKGHEFRNPRICEKLIEKFDIDQWGSNLPD